uniref:Uncharacterized protein n=1 Tax=Megaselia scalaris TaxID=36166 RepID=T1GN79_MEGSC
MTVTTLSIKYCTPITVYKIKKGSSSTTTDITIVTKTLKCVTDCSLGRILLLDGASPHYSSVLKRYLNEKCSLYWIGSARNDLNWKQRS